MLMLMLVLMLVLMPLPMTLLVLVLILTLRYWFCLCQCQQCSHMRNNIHIIKIRIGGESTMQGRGGVNPSPETGDLGV